MEERIAVGFVRIPTVFAVEGDHRQEGGVLLSLLDGTEPFDQVRGGPIRGGILVLEANRVREPRVAEEEMDRRAVALDAVRRIEQLGLRQLPFRIPDDRARE